MDMLDTKDKEWLATLGHSGHISNNKGRTHRKETTLIQWLLLLSGDILLNPGPVKYPCKVCLKNVRQNQKEQEPTTKGKNFMKIGHFNVNGLTEKFADIQLLLPDNNLDILEITETHPTGETDDKDLMIEGYTFIRRERTVKEPINGPKGNGGCLLYVKETIKVVPMNEKFEEYIGAIWIEICIHSQRMMI
eukprot:gene8410-14388_t